jgi:flagellar biosynthesis/type III secretory pathway protein FliH
MAFQSELSKLAPVEQEQVMEVTMSWKEAALQEGRQQGIERGIKQGIQEGKQQGMSELITQMVEHRLGPIEADLRRAIGGLDSKQLGTLGNALHDFSDVRDLTEWLRRL